MPCDGGHAAKQICQTKSMQHLCQVAHGPVLAGPMPSSCIKNYTFSWNLKPKNNTWFLLAPNPDQKSRISRIYKNQLMVCYGSAAVNRRFYAMKRLMILYGPLP